jgi:hypothetical protein
VKKPNQNALDLDTVLSSAAGRRFVWRLIMPCESDPTKAETNMTYYALGVQATARALEREVVTQHHDFYKLMLAERYSEDEDKTCITKDSE